MAGSEHLSIAQYGVLETKGGLAELRQSDAERQLVVEEGGLTIADERLHDDEAVPPLFQLLVGEPGSAEPLHATDLEVGEVAGAVDYPLRVGLGVADAELRLVYQRPPRRPLAALELGLAFLDKSPHAFPGILGSEE